MSLETETLQDHATFEHFGKEWKVPTKKHLSHIRFMRESARIGFGGMDLMIAEAFLSPAISKQNQQKPNQFAALLDIDPDEVELDRFTEKLSKALGIGGSGNSAPSSASS